VPLFNRRSGAVPNTRVRDRCWNDPDLDRLVDLVADAGQPADVRVRAVLDRMAAVAAEPDSLVQSMDAGGMRLTSDLDAVRRAADGESASSGSTASPADALALLATTLTRRAWEIRGSGRAETVGSDAFADFHRILEEADEIGLRAIELDPSHPGAAHCRLISGRGLGLQSDEWWYRFEVARRRKPTAYPAHCQMLQALCKKWYGSHELMFDFARRVAQEAPVGDPVGAVLALAHAEYLVEEGRASIPGPDLALAREASDRWVQGGETALSHPYALEAHQLFGWMLKGDAARRWFHLSRVGDRISSLPWDYINNGEASFRTLVAKGPKG
jgi:hypothetical protein